jgi:hypothetical protein
MEFRMTDGGKLRSKLIDALINHVKCEEERNAFLKPFTEAMTKGEIGVVTIGSAEEYDKLHNKCETAYKKYIELLRQYVAGNK